MGGEIVELQKKFQELEAQIGKNKKRKFVVDSDEEEEERQLDPLSFLAEVSLTHHIPSPKGTESSKGKKYFQSQRKKRRIYLSKGGIESLKAQLEDDTTAEDQSMDAVDT